MNNNNVNYSVAFLSIIILALLNGCSAYGPTQEEIQNASKNNLYGEVPSNYEKLIKDYLKKKQKLPPGLIEKISILKPVKRFIPNRHTNTTWWGVGSIVGISSTKLNESDMYESNNSIKFKDGSQMIDIKTYFFTTSWYYIKGNKVLGTSPFYASDNNIRLNQNTSVFTAK